MLSAGITNVVGDVFSSATASIGNEALKAIVHAGVQGTLGFMQGGNFFTAAASGLFSSIAAYGYGQAVGKAVYSAAEQVALGALSGGVGSTLAGGNFWEGVKIGAIVTAFNHTMHKMGNDPIKKRQKIVENARKNNGSKDLHMKKGMAVMDQKLINVMYSLMMY